MNEKQTTWCYWQGERSAALDLCLETIATHERNFKLLGRDEVAEMGGGEMLELTERRSPQVRADLIRLWLLARFGGQWIDADCISLRPLDLHEYLNDQVELVGFGNGAPRHFSNTILSAPADGELINEALARASDLVRSTPNWKQIPYGATGQGILGPMFAKHPERMRRCQRWRYGYLHYTDVGRFARPGPDRRHEYAAYWNPNACCYHLTGKGLVPFNEMSREQLLNSRTFAGFLFRRALSICRPKRSEEIIARLPTNGPLRGAEVGVLRGHNARVLLQQRPQLSLHLVDVWGQQPANSSYVRSRDGHARKSTAQWQQTFNAAKRAVNFAGDRVTFHRMQSSAAAAAVPDRSFDFVFVDADHSYDGCKRDLDAWLPKVKPGGWIGGHDYDHPREKRGHWGVKPAVDELADRLAKPINVGRDFTWFIGV